jgi:hypothetical protein
VGYFVHHFSSLLIFLLIQEPIYLYGWRRNRTIHNLRATLCCCGWLGGELISFKRGTGQQQQQQQLYIFRDLYSSSADDGVEHPEKSVMQMLFSLLRSSPLFIRFRPSPFFSDYDYYPADIDV